MTLLYDVTWLFRSIGAGGPFDAPLSSAYVAMPRPPIDVQPTPGAQGTAEAGSRWPPSTPSIILRLRLSHVEFPRDLPALFNCAQGGQFGKVLEGGVLQKSQIPVAVKVIFVTERTEREQFLIELEALLQLARYIDASRNLEEDGMQLSPEQAGALHVAYMYGAGEEENLSRVDPGLHNGPAFLIAVEPLTQTLAQRLRHGPPLLLVDVLRIARDIASGLAFMSKHGVVHADLKRECFCVHLL